jgi:hypothetical protein
MPFFALDLMFKYKMYDYACKYLYYRRENNELLQLIKFEYNESKLMAEALKSKISKAKTNGDAIQTI